jgi:hypothetical protein
MLMLQVSAVRWIMHYVISVLAMAFAAAMLMGPASRAHLVQGDDRDRTRSAILFKQHLAG